MQRQLGKIIWSEGLLLGQQHFQQWDHILEAKQRWRNRVVAPLAWGVVELVIDEEALLDNLFRVISCQVIYQHGLLVDYQQSAQLVLARELLPANGDHQEIYLAVANNDYVMGLNGYSQPAQAAAWQADYCQVADDYANDRQREVIFGRLNLRLLLQSEVLDQFSTLKIAEVVNHSGDSFKLKKDYIPPLVCISASSHLQQLVSGWLILIETKINQLHNYSNQNEAPLLLLQVLNSAFVNLLNVNNQATTHPQLLFSIMLNLISKLCAFSKTVAITTLPIYQHAQLTANFAVIDQLLRELLAQVMPNKSITLSLHKMADHLYQSNEIDMALLNERGLYLAVKFAAAEFDWIEQLGRQLKVAAVSEIDKLIASALTGIKVNYCRRLPSGLTVKQGYEYFYLEPTGDFWRQLVIDKVLAIFVPEDFISAELELIAEELV